MTDNRPLLCLLPYQEWTLELQGSRDTWFQICRSHSSALCLNCSWKVTIEQYVTVYAKRGHFVQNSKNPQNSRFFTDDSYAVLQCWRIKLGTGIDGPFLCCHTKNQPSAFYHYGAVSLRTWLPIAQSYHEPEMAALNYHSFTMLKCTWLIFGLWLKDFPFYEYLKYRLDSTYTNEVTLMSHYSVLCGMPPFRVDGHIYYRFCPDFL